MTTLLYHFLSNRFKTLCWLVSYDKVIAVRALFFWYKTAFMLPYCLVSVCTCFRGGHTIRTTCADVQRGGITTLNVANPHLLLIFVRRNIMQCSIKSYWTTGANHCLACYATAISKAVTNLPLKPDTYRQVYCMGLMVHCKC